MVVNFVMPGWTGEDYDYELQLLKYRGYLTGAPITQSKIDHS
jgi:hypothetical protein